MIEMTNEERMWWLTLVDAEVASTKNPEECLIFMDVANRARVTLRDRFNVNLDEIANKSTANFKSIVTELREKNLEKERQFLSLEETIQKGLDLLEKYKNGKT